MRTCYFNNITSYTPVTLYRSPKSAYKRASIPSRLDPDANSSLLFLCPNRPATVDMSVTGRGQIQNLYQPIHYIAPNTGGLIDWRPEPGTMLSVCVRVGRDAICVPVPLLNSPSSRPQQSASSQCDMHHTKHTHTDTHPKMHWIYMQICETEQKCVRGIKPLAGGLPASTNHLTGRVSRGKGGGTYHHVLVEERRDSSATVWTFQACCTGDCTST